MLIITSLLTILLLFLLIISAAQFLCITLQRVASRTGIMLQPRLRPDQISSQAELLFKSGSLQVGTADHSQITVLQGPVDGTHDSSIRVSSKIVYKEDTIISEYVIKLLHLSPDTKVEFTGWKSVSLFLK